jgi:hypothetical protein
MLGGVRALLRATSVEQVEEVFRATVLSLGGGCIADGAELAGAKPLVVAGGAPLALVVTAPFGSRARRVLAAALPTLYADVTAAISAP